MSAASARTIRAWVAAGFAEGATHVVIVCDDFDYDDYPVSVLPGQDAAEVAQAYAAKSMQRVMEVYAAHISLDDQMAERRAYHVEAAPTS